AAMPKRACALNKNCRPTTMTPRPTHSLGPKVKSKHSTLSANITKRPSSTESPVVAVDLALTPLEMPTTRAASLPLLPGPPGLPPLVAQGCHIPTPTTGHQSRSSETSSLQRPSFGAPSPSSLCSAAPDYC